MLGEASCRQHSQWWTPWFPTTAVAARRSFRTIEVVQTLALGRSDVMAASAAISALL